MPPIIKKKSPPTAAQAILGYGHSLGMHKAADAIKSGITKMTGTKIMKKSPNDKAFTRLMKNRRKQDTSGLQ